MRYSHRTELFTVAEVANFLKVSALTVYKYIKENKLEAILIGNHYRISSHSLDTFLRSHTIPVQSKQSDE